MADSSVPIVCERCIDIKRKKKKEVHSLACSERDFGGRGSGGRMCVGK